MDGAVSFASRVKKEICRAVPQRACCRRAECFGMALFTHLFTRKEGTFVSENSELVHRLALDIGETCGVFCEIETNMRRGGSSVLRIPGEDQRLRFLESFGYTGQELNLRLNRAVLENECCMSWFIRGAFLTCGTVTDPQKDYHLEFVVPHRKLAGDLVTLLREAEPLSLQVNMSPRKGAQIVYLKSSEEITDLLTYLGAPGAAMELMQQKMRKQVRNDINRKANFETANLDKTMSASARQVAAFQRLIRKMAPDTLPDDLREVLQLRLEEPEMSLREMGERLSLTRSGVNHRLRRLMEMADSAGKEEEKP